MPDIKYAPVNGQSEVVQSCGLTFAPGRSVFATDEQAKELLRARFFVDAHTGKNPNFICKVCQRETYDDAAFDPVLARTSSSPFRSLRVDDGRICPGCALPTAQNLSVGLPDDD